jgi:hypothetical protein
MAAFWGLFIIGFAVLSKCMGVTLSPLRFQNWNGPIYREQDPASFRKAVGVQIVIGLLFLIGWFVNLKWHVF